MKFDDLVSDHTDGAETSNHVFDKQIVNERHELAVSLRRTLLSECLKDHPLAAVVLVIVVQRSHAISDLENVCQFSIRKELQYVCELIVHMLAETPFAGLFRIMVEASENTEPKTSDSLRVPRDEFPVVFVQSSLHV